ncbi:N-methyl-L-tryptophan oxidase [Mycobacterium mantenii]|uniref:N-methyltryptophan oxidase n=1 Tax=Mycobacterium mantenii TaxID=560555 RepID=A0A1A2SQK0_MYCNT|nr:N-methyl-L-tryptophan oxidase [Mycobacterium mantenii]OBH40966.1 N-methyltryptophan oxidase [Mycobacterium mantenii]OBH66386.1 N-methyltryptophan oxidase [Mycobacterium mantenii]
MVGATTGYDVIVVGLGGMGSAAAYHLASRGCRVLGLERHEPAHDKGSSHGGSRIIRQAYFEDPGYVPLLLRAYELWEKLAADSQCDVYRLTGGLLIGPPDSLIVAGSLRASRQWDLPHESLDAAEITARFPNFRPGPEDIAVYDAKAGFARPELTVRAHLEIAEKAGATLQFGESVLHWSQTATGVRVVTAHGTYTAGRLVICPGAWAPQVLGEFGIPIQVERQVMYWLDPAGGASAFEAHPVFIHENYSGTHIYGFPALDGPRGGVKVAFARNGTACTPETIDRVVHEREISEIQARVAEVLPALAGKCVRAATCMYSNSPDRHFVIGRHPQSADIIMACGFSGHGFKFVPVVGEILADLAIDGATDHPIALFDPLRPRPA